MDDTTRRVWRLILAIGLVGSAAALAVQGPKAGAAFAVGVIISAANYRWL